MIILSFDGQAHPDRRRQRDDPESLRHDVRRRGRRDGLRGALRRRGAGAGAADASRSRHRGRRDARALRLRPVRVDQGRSGAAGGPGAHPGVQPAAVRRRPRSKSWRGRPAGQAVGHDRDDGQGPRAAARGGRLLPPCARLRAPAAAPARSAASLPTAAIDDDEYGEISIDTGRESVPTIPRVPAATSTAARPVTGGASAAHPCRPCRWPRPPHRCRRPPAARLVARDAAVADSGHAAGGHAARAPGDGARRVRRARCPRPRRRARRLSRSGGR